MNKSPQSLKVKEKSVSWLSAHATKIQSFLLALIILFLPTQLGKHFWPSFSLVNGIRVDYLSPTIYATDILIGLLFLHWIVTKGFLSLSKVGKIVLIILILFIVLNSLFAQRSGLSIFYGVKLLEFSFFGYIVSQTVRFKADFTSISLLLSIGVFFESVLAFLQYLNQASLNGWLYYLGERIFDGSTPGIANASINGTLILRPYGTFSHPNVLAAYLFLSMIFIYFFLFRRVRDDLKIFSFIILLIGSIALLLSLSRIIIAMWLLLLVSLIIFHVSKRFRSTKVKIITLIILLIIGSIAILSPFGQTLLDRFAQTSFGEEALVQREELFTNALTIFLSHPLLGVGLGNFIPALAPLQNPLSIGLYLQPVHDIYILAASETGIIGASLFSLFLILTFRRLISKNHLTPLSKSIVLPLVLLLSVILVAGLFDHYFLTLQQGQLLFAFILGLCWNSLNV